MDLVVSWINGVLNSSDASLLTWGCWVMPAGVGIPESELVGVIHQWRAKSVSNGSCDVICTIESGKAQPANECLTKLRQRLNSLPVQLPFRQFNADPVKGLIEYALRDREQIAVEMLITVRDGQGRYVGPIPGWANLLLLTQRELLSLPTGRVLRRNKWARFESYLAAWGDGVLLRIPESPIAQFRNARDDFRKQNRYLTRDEVPEDGQLRGIRNRWIKAHG